MSLALSEDHCVLAEVARSMLTERDASGAARAALEGNPEPAAALWKEMVALGWPGLHVPERYGGQGYGLAELTIVAEELGRYATPGPFLTNAVVAEALVTAGTNAQKERWLPALIAGELTAGLGLSGSVRIGGKTVSGDGGPVLAATRAHLAVVRAGDDLVFVERDESTCHVVDNDTIDPGRSTGWVSLRGAAVADAIRGGVVPARRAAWVLAAAEAVGGLGMCTEMAVGYAGVREQFERLIGSFQAVKHHCVNMLAATELASALTWDAARSTDDQRSDELAAVAAVGWSLPAFLRVAGFNIQVHGGIGYTWEHVANVLYRRATALAAFFGRPSQFTESVTNLRLSGVTRRATVDLPAEAEGYRMAAHAFAQEHLQRPESERQVHFARSGYLVPHWPEPFGRKAGPVEQLVIDDELADLDRPSLGLGEWVLPTLLQHGDADQIARWIWPSLEGAIRWCQLFSEPGAGSDAAAVSTRAQRVDGGWIVNGQKVWTSEAHLCSHGLATVRTDTTVAKHRGITAMAVDMHADGIEVRPLTELTGESLFNEVFFTDVFVPDADVVGAVNDGWRVARSTLGNERVSIGSNSITMEADGLLALLERHDPEDVGLRREVGALLIESQALQVLNIRQASRALASVGFGAEGSLCKLIGAEHAQRVVEVGMRIAGTAALLGTEPALVRDFFLTRCLTIAGGTSEVLRNQIGERILGLPREPRVQEMGAP